MKNLVYLILMFFTASVSAQSYNADILKHKGEIVVTELTKLNSVYRQTNLSITPDGKYLYFMSDRGGMPWSSVAAAKYKGKIRFDGDIYYSRFLNNEWQVPVCLSNQINTYSGEDEPNISVDGQIVTYQSWKTNWQTTGGPYYSATLNGVKWSDSEGLAGGINKFFITEFNKNFLTYATDGMAIGPNNDIFIVACGANYDGQMDIYLSIKSNNEWSYCEKLNISTIGDERSVFIAGDGKTIFFASTGYGGFDIFKTTLKDDGSCSEVINIGEPFNTNQDDYGFIITASGKDAYFVRDGNIFYAEIEDANDQLKPDPTVIISGSVTDCNGKAIEVILSLLDNKDDIITSSHSNSVSGEFCFVIPSEQGDYQIKDKSGYNIDTTVTVAKSDEYLEITVDIKNCRDNIGKYDPENNTLMVELKFDNNTEINDEYVKSLNELVKYLDDFKNYTIEIYGYKEMLRPDGLNYEYGKMQCEAVKQKLMDYGTDEGLIEIVDYGELGESFEQSLLFDNEGQIITIIEINFE